MFTPGQLVRCVRGHDEREREIIAATRCSIWPNVVLVTGRIYTVRKAGTVTVGSGKFYDGIGLVELPPAIYRRRTADGTLVEEESMYNALRFTVIDDTKLDALREHLSASLWKHRTVG